MRPHACFSASTEHDDAKFDAPPLKLILGGDSEVSVVNSIANEPKTNLHSIMVLNEYGLLNPIFGSISFSRKRERERADSHPNCVGTGFRYETV